MTGTLGANGPAHPSGPGSDEKWFNFGSGHYRLPLPRTTNL